MYQIYNHVTGNFLETLVILGNGFDIAHGIPSKYSDFHDYLMYQKKSNLLYQCDQYFSVEDFWANVEQSLGKIDYSHIVEEELSYLENASDRDEDNERNRFEAVLDDFSCRFLVELTDMVNEWVLSFNYQNLAKQYFEIIDNNKLFLSFNYSSTLEEIYGINQANILYLHGKAVAVSHPHPSDVEVPHSELIIGHALEEYNFNDEKRRSHFLSSNSHKTKPIRKLIVIENEQKIVNYFNNSRKKTSDILNHNEDFFNKIFGIRKLIIFGHSLSEIDLLYFKKISQKLIYQDIAIVIYDCENQLENRKKVICDIFTKANVSCIATNHRYQLQRPQIPQESQNGASRA